MKSIIFLLVETIIVYLVIFFFNYFVFVRKNKKLEKDDMPLELIYLATIYKIDPRKVKFRNFQYTYCFLNAFIITSTYLAVSYLVKNALMKVILGIVLLILLIIICYGLLGRFYQYRQQKTTKK
jgi:uncharacterized membrane protein